MLSPKIRTHVISTLLGMALGGALGGLAWARLPQGYAARGLVRVAAVFPPGEPFVNAPTAATEATRSDLCREINEGTLGVCAWSAIFNTDLVEVTATSRSPEDSEVLVDRVTRALVERQNASAVAVFGQSANAWVRPAQRVEPLGRAQSASLGLSNLVLLGALLGGAGALLLRTLLSGLRDA